jgi:hypothetical protein
MDTERAALSRSPCLLLKLYMGACAKENPFIGAGGGNECAATEACYYTWPTCQNPINYEETICLYQFSNVEALISGARPLLNQRYTELPIKIVSDKFITEVGQLSFTLVAPDAALGYSLANPDKNIGGYSLRETGEFWPVFMARNPNFKGRIVELYRGFKGIDPADFELDFRGTIFDIDWDGSGVKIIVRGLLANVEAIKIPNGIPTTVILNDDPLAINATSLTLAYSSGLAYNAAEHFESATDEQKRCIKIEDEIIQYSGITDNSDGTSTLSGLVRGAFGSAAASHDKGQTIVQLVIYAEDDAADWEGCSGIGADWILLDLLCHHGKIAPDYMEMVDYTLYLDGTIGADDDSILLSSASVLVNQGCIKIDNELIYFQSVSGNTLLLCLRGLFETQKATHENGATVYIASVTDTLTRWRGSVPLLKNGIEGRVAIADKIKTLREDMKLDVWQNESGRIEVKLQSPPLGALDFDFTEDDFIDRSKTVRRNESSRITRLLVWYCPKIVDPKTSGDKAELDYNYSYGYSDLEAESSVSFGEKIVKTIFAEWIYQEIDAAWLAVHMYAKYKEGAPIIEAEIELKDSNKAVGDLGKITVKEFVDKSGTPLAMFSSIIKKIRKSAGRFFLAFEYSGFGAAGDVKYGLIGPPEGYLQTDIDEVDRVIVINIDGTGMTIADWRTGGHHQIWIENEKITYTTAADLGAGLIQLTGVTRGVDGTTPVAHTDGPWVVMLYSAASDDFRQYGFIGSAVQNFLDGDGDLWEETQGYVIY